MRNAKNYSTTGAWHRKQSRAQCFSVVLNAKTRLVLSAQLLARVFGWLRGTGGQYISKHARLAFNTRYQHTPSTQFSNLKDKTDTLLNEHDKIVHTTSSCSGYSLNESEQQRPPPTLTTKLAPTQTTETVQQHAHKNGHYQRHPFRAETHQHFPTPFASEKALAGRNDPDARIRLRSRLRPIRQ